MSDKRNTGIDLLRIVSMLMVVHLHVLAQGGVMVRISTHPSSYYAAWLLESACFCSVNIYGLISGYVGVNSKHRVSRIIELWVTVVFYTLIITAASGFIHPEWITRQVIWQSVFPVVNKTYWYFSGYFVLFFITPFLNKMILSLTERERKKLLIVLFLLFSVLTMIPKIFTLDFIQLIGGFSFVWLMLLYIAGGCMRLCSFPAWNKLTCLLLYLSQVILAWVSKILIENKTRKIYGEPKYGRLFVTYTAPTIVLCAVALLVLFRQLKFRNSVLRTLITKMSSLAFSVYIIHTHPVIWDNVLKNAFSSWRSLPWTTIVFPVMGAAVLIFFGCLMIDALRDSLFRVLKIRKFADAAGRILENAVEKLVGPNVDTPGEH